MGPAVAPARAPSSLPTYGNRLFALGVLFSMNLLNYVDRYSFFAVGKHIQDDLGVSYSRYGFLSVSFMIVYTVVSPLMGWLGDRYNRKVLLAFGVGLWSVATVGTAFSIGFADMVLWRALLGVGEATYGVIAPALLADLFAPKYRGRVMGAYFLALPLGGALGYGIGGWVADAWHWRAAFWVVGLPGVFAAAAALLLRDPGRGASDGQVRTAAAGRPRLADYLDLFRTPTFLFNTAGMAAVTFATGAYAAWGSTFYQSVHELEAKEAGLWIGGMTAVAGLVGISLGTAIADLLRRFTRRAYLLLAAASVFGAIVPGFLGMVERDTTTSMALLFVAMIMISCGIGPCNAVTANVVPANRRAAGYAVSIFLIHLFGDITSPMLIGLIADLFGSPTVTGSAVGMALETLGARPVDGANLTLGMLSVIPVLVLGGVFFLLGSTYLPRDQERGQGSGSEDDGFILLH
jgi:MFS family permease